MLRIFLAWLLDYSGSTIGRGGDLVEHVSSVPVVCARFGRMVTVQIMGSELQLPCVPCCCLPLFASPLDKSVQRITGSSSISAMEAM